MCRDCHEFDEIQNRRHEVHPPGSKVVSYIKTTKLGDKVIDSCVACIICEGEFPNENNVGIGDSIECEFCGVILVICEHKEEEVYGGKVVA